MSNKTFVAWRYIAILHTSFENMGEPRSAKQGSNKSIFLQAKTDQYPKKKGGGRGYEMNTEGETYQGF